MTHQMNGGIDLAMPRAGRAHRRIRPRARRSVHAALAAAAAFAVLTAGSASAATATQNQRATVIPALRTKTLFAKVHRAYLHVPAVELSVIPGKSTYRTPRRFVLILRSGVVVAEEFTRSGRTGTTLVARIHHPTYSRMNGATCWRRLPSSNPQTLMDVGIPYPYTRVRIKALQPRKTAFGWDVLTANRAEFWFLAVAPKPPAELRHGYHQRFISYAINAKSYLLRSLNIQQPRKGPQKTWPTATLRVTSLATAPQLPAPTPAC